MLWNNPFGLAAQMLDKKYAPPNWVKDLAAHYIKEMQILQPDRPYFPIELLFNKGLQTARDRTLFGVCLYTACRIAEACSLMVKDI